MSPVRSQPLTRPSAVASGLGHGNAAEYLTLLQIAVIILPAAIEGVIGMRFSHPPGGLPENRPRELAPSVAKDRIELLDEGCHHDFTQ
jgi:hypothetical protein